MTDEPMKIAVDYPESAALLKKYLGFAGSPVAFKFATKKEDIPAGMEELDKTIRYCMMVTLASKEKKAFYATAAHHECNGGAWSLGLKELTPSLKTGEFYFKLGKFASAPAKSGRSTAFRTLPRAKPMQQCTRRSRARRLCHRS